MATIIWESAVVGMLRYVINDMDAPYTYTDTKLKNMILYAGFMLNKDISFSQSYTFDLTQLTISPDPVTNKDFAFINLSVLKAAVILARNTLRSQVGQAISWKDGQSSLDSKELYKAQKMVLDSVQEEFDAAYLQMQFGDTAPGNAILGPYSSDRLCFGGDQGGMFTSGSVDHAGRGQTNFGTQGY